MTLKYLTSDDLEEVYSLVQNTIIQCYPKHYAPGAVEFFCGHHSRENIASDIQSGRVYGIFSGETLAGTGTIDGNHITRVFVTPEFQRKGYGSYLFDVFENRIFENYENVVIDSSLASGKMYPERGYVVISKEKIDCADGSVLEYDVMEKTK